MVKSPWVFIEQQGLCPGMDAHHLTVDSSCYYFLLAGSGLEAVSHGP